MKLALVDLVLLDSYLTKSDGLAKHQTLQSRNFSLEDQILASDFHCRAS